MERKRRIRSGVLTLWLIMFCGGCCRYDEAEQAEIMVRFSDTAMQCRTPDPDEGKISEISLMIFDESGSAEECIRIEDYSGECQVRLVTGREYTFCACVNFGKEVYADHIDELDEIRFYLIHADEYRAGIPMYACKKIRIEEGCREICLPLERLMAKISLRMDRRRLSDNVNMSVRSVRIGNCPKTASVFKPSRIRDEDDCFPVGFLRNGTETDVLNKVTESGMSGFISLYMLENMQGTLDSPIDEDSDKVFTAESFRSRVCSYIEMDVEYTSDLYVSGSRGLTYRFYLGENRNSLDVERNCHYRIIVAPEDDGLSENSWRVDKSGLSYTGPTSLKSYPASYIVGDIGDRIHIWCELQPSDAPFDVGLEYLEADKANGIYDYVIDEDGHGVVLTLRGPGTGAVYMEAGPPINDAAVFFIEVNLPK